MDNYYQVCGMADMVVDVAEDNDGRNADRIRFIRSTGAQSTDSPGLDVRKLD
jgi:hypothetical protein